MRSRAPQAIFALSLALLVGILLVLTGQAPRALQTALLPDSAPATEKADEPRSEPASDPAPPRDAFGIPTSLQEQTATVKNGETFADILTRHDVPYTKVVELVEEAEPVFDARRIRRGHTYRTYEEQDSVRYFVYQRDPVNYVVFDLSDSLHVYEGAREVDIVQKEVEARIEGSLYGSLNRAGASPLLTLKLANVYDWQIDFFRIQKGDYIKAIYEERQIDGKPIGLGKIVASRLIHMGNDFYAFYFEQDGRSEYFDDQAENLRKAFLRAPLEYGRITSSYSKNRYHPILKRNRAHLGTDYAAPTGTPIRSVGDGVVTKAEYKRGNGNYVKIRHNSTYETQYLHMSKIGDGIKPGERVRQGDVIGYVGSTGLATGPHVCYRFWKDGRQVDPYEQDIPSADPVEAEHMAAYETLKDRLMPRLETEKEANIRLTASR